LAGRRSFHTPTLSILTKPFVSTMVAPLGERSAKQHRDSMIVGIVFSNRHICGSQSTIRNMSSPGDDNPDGLQAIGIEVPTLCRQRLAPCGHADCVSCGGGQARSGGRLHHRLPTAWRLKLIPPSSRRAWRVAGMLAQRYPPSRNNDSPKSRFILPAGLRARSLLPWPLTEMIDDSQYIL
jgi:hypothetical protein